MESPSTRVSPRLAGAVFALLAYGSWGLAPIYWKWVRTVPALQLVAHRVVWSLPVLWILVLRANRGPALLQALRSRRLVQPLVVTAVLIAGNWLVFIWAVQSGRVLQASLGYYINPLVNVALALAFLRERLRAWQGVAAALATVGVLNAAYGLGSIPWVSLLLAASFGIYGLLRKTAAVDALVGLAIEVLLLWPFALGYLFWTELHAGGLLSSGSFRLLAAVALSGPVTAFPLLWFANAARRLSYTAVGFFQYVAPTGHLLLAVSLFDEPFSSTHAMTFACIWLALGIYAADTLRVMVTPDSSPAGKARP